MAPLTVSFKVSMAFQSKQIVAFSLIIAVTGKIVMRVRKGKTSGFFLLFILTLMMKSYLKRSCKSRKTI